MTQQQTDKFPQPAEPMLEPGEQLLDVAVIQPTRRAQGAGLGLTQAAGAALAGIGAVEGGR
jgi:hypothetical protein